MPPPDISVRTGLGESIKHGLNGIYSLFTPTSASMSSTQGPIDCKKVIAEYDMCLTTSKCSPAVMSSIVEYMKQCRKTN